MFTNVFMTLQRTIWNNGFIRKLPIRIYGHVMIFIHCKLLFPTQNMVKALFLILLRLYGIASLRAYSSLLRWNVLKNVWSRIILSNILVITSPISLYCLQCLVINIIFAHLFEKYLICLSGKNYLLLVVWMDNLLHFYD